MRQFPRDCGIRLWWCRTVLRRNAGDTMIHIKTSNTSDRSVNYHNAVLKLVVSSSSEFIMYKCQLENNNVPNPALPSITQPWAHEHSITESVDDHGIAISCSHASQFALNGGSGDAVLTEFVSSQQCQLVRHRQAWSSPLELQHWIKHSRRRKLCSFQP